MSLSVGIVGLPNAGKSTLFNAILKRQQARTGKHPFTTIEPNKGVVAVPDQRLSQIASLAGIAKQTPVSITFVDIAGLVKGANQGEGLGNQFLAHIRETDVILHVVRGFTDSTVPHVHPSIDPADDLAIINTELALADLAMLDRAIENYSKDLKLVTFLKKIKTQLDQKNNLDDVFFSAEEKAYLKKFPLLSIKPQVIVINLDEKDINNPNYPLKEFQAIPLCAKLEEALAPLSWIEQQQYLKAFNLPQPAMETIIKKCFEKLNLLVFYTIAKGKEAKAWSAAQGITAHQAAGQIHTDFTKKFIKALVASYSDFIKEGSWEKLKAQGKIRIEGKEAIIHDGDIVEFKIGD